MSDFFKDFDKNDVKLKSWSRKDIFLLTYSIIINIFTLGLIFYIVL